MLDYQRMKRLASLALALALSGSALAKPGPELAALMKEPPKTKAKAASAARGLAEKPRENPAEAPDATENYNYFHIIATDQAPAKSQETAKPRDSTPKERAKPSASRVPPAKS